MDRLSRIIKEVLLEKKKKRDRCLRIADRKFDKPSAYKSGAVVRCRKGKIWKGVKEENLILALLQTYRTGKDQYYNILNTLLEALGEFDDPEVKKAVIEIAHSDDYPVDIRKKAIDNLAAFNDPSGVDGLLPLLEDKENYIYYDNIFCYKKIL